MNTNTQSYIDMAETALRIGDNIEHLCGDIKVSTRVMDLMGVGKYNKVNTLSLKKLEQTNGNYTRYSLKIH